MLEEDVEDGEEPSFEVCPGSGRYHAIVGTEPSDIGAEMKIAEELSLEGDEPVYSIDHANDPWTVASWRKGALEILEVDPESLAESLGCPLPGGKKSSELSARKPLRHVALVEGVQAQEAHLILEEEAGKPLVPGRYRLEDTPRGLLIASGTGDIGFADISVSERIPLATAYAVIASPGLDMFLSTFSEEVSASDNMHSPLGSSRLYRLSARSRESAHPSGFSRHWASQRNGS